jgi:hypothetical protein
MLIFLIIRCTRDRRIRRCRLNPALEIPLHKSFVLWSQRANLLASFAIAYIVQTNGSGIAALFSYLASAVAADQGPLSGMIAFMVVSYLRLLPQSKPAMADSKPSVVELAEADEAAQNEKRRFEGYPGDRARDDRGDDRH